MQAKLSMNLGAWTLLVSVHLGFFVFSTKTFADDVTLTESTDAQAKIDAGLENWVQAHSVVSPMSAVNDEEFEKFLMGKDPLARLIFELRYAVKNKKMSEEKINAAVETYKQNKKSKHLLKNFLAEEILRSNPSDSVKTFLVSELDASDERSCATQDFLKRKIKGEFGTYEDLSTFVTLLDRIASFESNGFQREAIEELVKAIPKSQREAMKYLLEPWTEKYSFLLARYKWLEVKPGGEKTAVQKAAKASEPFGDVLKPVQVSLNRRRCRDASVSLSDAMPSLKGKMESLETVIKFSEDIAACFRMRSKAQRLTFWKEIQPKLQDAYNTKGWLAAQMNIARYTWSNDKIDQAVKMFKEGLAKAKETEDRKYQAEALYSLAQIAEENKDLPTASEYYSEYVDKYESEVDYEPALMSLVLMHTDQQNTAEALKPLKIIIDRQTDLPVDQRSFVSLPFALFWAGRIYYSQGDNDQAIELWKRAALEYYSTFYGALGHYMLEKVTNKRYIVKTGGDSGAPVDRLFERFSGRSKELSDRARLLLASGMREEARCELDELKTDKEENEKILAHSLLLFSSGLWRQAIALFVNLPRSYRNTLPTGYETILFPRAFETAVQDFANRLGVDPSFVMSVIRQESIFNPNAISIAGAQGLMQLMPQTAKQEVRLLGKKYVTKDQKQNMHGHKKFYDAETNIALGTHLLYRLINMYKHPVYALTSYNASPSATQKWLKKFSTADLLAFIERIPYNETRSYVKLVIRNYFYYRKWYEGGDAPMPQLDEIIIPASLEKDKTELKATGESNVKQLH